jgi:hypothetical protein
MSSAFERAVEWVRQQATAGKPLPAIQKEMPEFKDERFTVNRVALLDPVTVGYADPKAAFLGASFVGIWSTALYGL